MQNLIYGRRIRKIYLVIKLIKAVRLIICFGIQLEVIYYLLLHTFYSKFLSETFKK